MKASFEKLVDGAAGAATESIDSFLLDKPDFALLISCVGRKIVMNQRIDDEVEVVQVILGNDVCLAGFYSNGEVSPMVSNQKCELHNQTMTITTYKEI
jgi:small ligand-binding sensory domain FIST